MDPTLRIAVPPELFAPAESSRFEGALELPSLQAGPDESSFPDPLAWHVEISNTGDALLVTGTVSGEAIGSCARCLDGFRFDLEGEIEGYYLLDESRSAPEDMDDDEFDVLPEDHVIDLEPLIKAALILEFPLVPLCDEECKGLCAVCGANLNEGPCECAPTEGANDGPANPFSVLKDFPFDDR